MRKRAALLAAALVSALTAVTAPVGAQAAYPPSSFYPQVPLRVLDTRVSGTPLGAHGTMDVAIAGQNGVPAGATSVAVNVTVTDTTASSYLTVWPTGVARPLASSLNWRSGQLVANLVEVPVGTGGAVSIYNDSGSASVILDVQGYFLAGRGGAGFHPLMPSRVLDTRTGLGRPAGRVSGPIPFVIAGVGNVPGSGVAAVIVNLTVTNPVSAGYVTVYPTGNARPLASNLNFGPGQTVANRAIVQLSPAGSFTLDCACAGADLIVDVNGYLSPANPSSDQGLFVPLAPTRILDTRSGTGSSGMIGPGSSASFPVVGVDGVAASGIGAVVLNLTATDGSAMSYLTAFPSGNARVLASDVNFPAASTVPNLIVVKPGPDGRVSLFNSVGSTHAVADVLGYFIAVPSIGGPPRAPRAVSAVAGDRSATVTWQPPAGSDLAITTYVVSVHPGTATVVTDGTATSVVFGGLVNQSTYTFSVTAVNGFSSGPDSAASNAVTPVGTPDPPTGVQAVAGRGTATITWTPPANNGGFPVTGYVVTLWPNGALAAASGTSFTWRGLPQAVFWFTVQAVNAAGWGPASAPSNPVVPLPSHLIVVSLSAQHLWAYDGDTLLMQTDVATGRPELPTPPGDYHIMNKQSPFQFISPWPITSPYYYPSAWVSYAMEFIPGGYYLHDAPWRTWYGPGSNLYNGTHGCVNIPLGPMTWLYGWANVGDEVIVQN